jgi:hypothetical protein
VQAGGQGSGSRPGRNFVPRRTEAVNCLGPRGSVLILYPLLQPTQVRPFCNHKLVQTVAYEPIWLQPNSLIYSSTMP